MSMPYPDYTSLFSTDYSNGNMRLNEESVFPGSGSNVSLTSACSTSSSKTAHNPYSLSNYMVEVGDDGLEIEKPDVDENDCDTNSNSPNAPDDGLYRGTMVLLKEGQKEIVMAKAEVVKRMRRAYGYVDSEVATPCFHFGRCRLRYKNSITHCRCRTCGLKWREIAYCRIRPDQMEEFQRSFANSKTDRVGMVPLDRAGMIPPERVALTQAA